MAKQTEKTELQKATEELRQAELAYDKLIKLDVSTMKDQSGHREACRKALDSKKAAQQKVRNIKLGKI